MTGHVAAVTFIAADRARDRSRTCQEWSDDGRATREGVPNRVVEAIETFAG